MVDNFTNFSLSQCYLWTYSSTSPGMSKLKTCFTLGMSRPCAATAIATMIGVWPTFNLRQV